jgi:uncharacterized protein YPO0396
MWSNLTATCRKRQIRGTVLEDWKRSEIDIEMQLSVRQWNQQRRYGYVGTSYATGARADHCFAAVAYLAMSL